MKYLHTAKANWFLFIFAGGMLVTSSTYALVSIVADMASSYGTKLLAAILLTTCVVGLAIFLTGMAFGFLQFGSNLDSKASGKN